MARRIDHLPGEPGRYVRQLHDDYVRTRRDLELAQPRHLADAFDFASRAWRRPLTDGEKDRLRAFYRHEQPRKNLIIHKPFVRC